MIELWNSKTFRGQAQEPEKRWKEAKVSEKEKKSHFHDLEITDAKNAFRSGRD